MAFAIAVSGAPRCASAHCAEAQSWRSPHLPTRLRPFPSNTGVSAATPRRSIIVALRGGHHLPAARDPLRAPRRWLRAIAVVASRRQVLAIAGPRRLEQRRALPLKDAGTARRERDAGLPRARPKGSHFSGSDFYGFDFGFPTGRGRAGLELGP